EIAQVCGARHGQPPLRLAYLRRKLSGNRALQRGRQRVAAGEQQSSGRESGAAHRGHVTGVPLLPIAAPGRGRRATVASLEARRGGFPMRLAGLALALASIAVLSCANVRVRTDYDTAIDFAPLQTYAWLDPPLREASREEGGQGGDPFTQTTLGDKRVGDEVNAG